MPLFDQRVPINLLNVQKWFGEVISSPLTSEDKISLKAPSGNSIIEESKAFILPSQTLSPYQRMEIYNQQYWWRLLTILQEAFPTLLRLFGYDDFNKIIAVPYLNQNKANDWSLNTLGNRLLNWAKESYHEKDKQLIYDAIQLDHAYQELFFAPEFTRLNKKNEEFSVKPLYIQPSCLLLNFSYDLLDFRKKLLKSTPEYWLEHPFPELKKVPTFILLYRAMNGIIKTITLSKTESEILRELQKGVTIDSLCEWIEKQSKSFRDRAEKELQNWFREWTVMGILYQ